MTEERVFRERGRMLDLECYTAIMIEKIKREPADPEDGRFGYRERHLAEYICEAAGGAVVSVRDVLGEPIWSAEAPETRQEALALAKKLLEDIDGFERCTKNLDVPDMTPELRREISANWCVYHQSALEAVCP